MTTTSQLLSQPLSLGHPRPRLATPPQTTATEAVRVLRTAARSGLLERPIPYQVYAHARIAEMNGDARQWRRAGCVIGRGNGKSTGILAPYILDSLEQGIGVLGLAQNLDVAMETYNTVADTVEGDPFLSKRLVRKPYRGKGQARMDLRDPRTGRVAIYRVSVTAKKCRGPRAPRIAVDEAAYVDNRVMSAARYVQNGSGLPHLQQVMAVCTAGDDSEDERGELGWFSRWRNAHLEATDPRLLWLEWSIPEDQDPFDRAWWPYAVPALGHFISELEIEDNLDDPDFVQEALSRWGVTTRRAIPADLWNACALEPDAAARLDQLRPAVGGLGLAVSPDAESAALVAAYAHDGRILVKVLDERPGTSWALPVVRERTRAARQPVLMDGKGPGGELADALEAAGVAVHRTGTDEYTNACQAFLNDVRGRTVAHYGQPGLDQAVAGARKRDVGDRWVWARRAADVAALEAATLAASRVRHAPTRPRVV
jgi:hypothetical protein